MACYSSFSCAGSGVQFCTKSDYLMFLSLLLCGKLCCIVLKFGYPLLSFNFCFNVDIKFGVEGYVVVIQLSKIFKYVCVVGRE